MKGQKIIIGIHRPRFRTSYHAFFQDVQIYTDKMTNIGGLCQLCQKIRKPLYDETYKIKDNTLYGWMKKFGRESEIMQHQAFKSEGHQLRELQKQIRDLQEENEILKKAMHFFAKDRR
ncbi:transposase [Paenibacillus popilliae]|uniref:Transposase and inactivated derivative n=1 Tax=Paenibacillus popilliae ATCC 14706 TaxID=1212764 RepID=M9LKU2_PAEPP|nr:transposase [Paenibacillus popilliae]GAC43980.1 transposase and inactivated derivative [Paenibacillus popilliae ATCC 14706]